MNSIRVDATSLEHAIKLLMERSKEYYDVDLQIRSYPDSFGVRSITHDAPLGKPTNWASKDHLPVGHLGWGGTWKGTIRGKYGDRRELGFSDFVGSWSAPPAFLGFHTGSGSGGKDFHISGTIFLEDFPKMYKPLIKKYEGNKLCCYVHPFLECVFCKVVWCDPCTSLFGNVGHRCPFDGHNLLRR